MSELQGPRGEPGLRGDVGPKGYKGDIGTKGDIGVKGDHGPDGDQGRIGAKGDTGSRGDRGVKGDRGEPGVPADPRKIRANSHRLLFLYLLTVALFLAGAFILQRQQRAIAEQQRQIRWNAYTTCLTRNVNVARLNRTFDELAAIERTNPYTGAHIGIRRIQVYADAKFTLSDCGSRPKGTK